MGDNQRGIGYAEQDAFDVPNIPDAPQYGVRAFGDPLQVEADSPHYDMNTEGGYGQTRIRYKKRSGSYHVEIDVTPDNLKPLVASNLGPGVGGVYKAGVGAPVYLSVREGEGLAQNWQGKNARANMLELNYDLDNGLQATADLLGPPPALVTSAWNTPAPIPSALVPFDAWQVVIRKGSDIYCVRRVRVVNDRKMGWLYCSPQADPDNTTQAGLTPTRATAGNAEAAFEVEALYLGDSGSEYEAFRYGLVSEGWQVLARDPSSGGTAAVQIDLSRIGYISGELQRVEQVWQVMRGFALYKAEDGTPLIITITD